MFANNEVQNVVITECDGQEICPHCDYVNDYVVDENTRTIICKGCGERILLCSLCDMDEVDCSQCPYDCKGNVEPKAEEEKVSCADCKEKQLLCEMCEKSCTCKNCPYSVLAESVKEG